MLGCLLYADHIVIMSECGEESQRMLDAVSGHGRDLNVKFNSDKSQVLVINGGEDDAERKCKRNGKDISCTNEYRYLGCALSMSGCEKAKNEKMLGAQQWYERLASVARFKANRYECLMSIWESMAVPSIIYGMNIMK